MEDTPMGSSSGSVSNLSNRLQNMDLEEVEVQDWIKDMSTQELRITMREIASIDNYGDFYPGGYVLPREQKETTAKGGRKHTYYHSMLDVNDTNREKYERELAMYLTNVEKQNN